VLASLWVLYSFVVHVLPHLGHGPQYYRHLYVAAISAAVAAANIWYSERRKTGQT
jgi:dolichyl-phosphate-mannose--protein O-mannosyl transferase